jgi:dolichol-phosphate mannosyltransferase
VIPARDEERRIGPCLAGLARDPDVHEVIVVDDGSADRTADVAHAHGARVVRGTERPGWVGKPWALQQGLEAASGEVVVALDADTRPRAGLAGALAAALEAADLVTASARFVCDSAAERLLHPSMLASLVYRYGPADSETPGRLLANGQVTAVRRAQLLAAGGYAAAAGHMTDDAALARALADDGWRVVFVDGTALVDVRMYESAAETWREWGRSLALPDVTPPAWQAADLAVVWLAMALPIVRLAAGRPTGLDLALLGLRGVLLAPLAGAYARRGVPYWFSPLADPATALRLTQSALRPARTWRGRTYPA